MSFTRFFISGSADAATVSTIAGVCVTVNSQVFHRLTIAHPILRRMDIVYIYVCTHIHICIYIYIMYVVEVQVSNERIYYMLIVVAQVLMYLTNRKYIHILLPKLYEGTSAYSAGQQYRIERIV